ncbi:TPA: hypothetical protein ACIVGF_002882 [Salmonella enterica subsp. enterica serovar 16:l,v:-]|nr:hypothetical protein [Salmonella enterica]
MKKLYLAAFFLLAAPLVHATGIPCATCGIIEKINKDNQAEKPVFVILGTAIKSNTITPKEITLIDKNSPCFYSGVLTETLSENKNNLIIDVSKKICPTKTEKVAYSVLNIKADENYSEGTEFKLYHTAVMTPAGPLFSADVIKDMIKDLSDAAEKMPAKGVAN